MEALGGLRPYFRKDGLVTAGNASGIGDGSASAVLAGADWAEANGVSPIGRIVSWGFVGVEPQVMGIGPAPAARLALEKAGLSLGDLEAIEINEAFASMAVASTRIMELDRDIVNQNGSGCSLGHPIACTGARMIVSMVNELIRSDSQLGAVAMCAAGGMGSATIIERV